MKDLSYATSIVHSMVNPQSTLPILGNILIHARKDSVTFVSSDLESCVECTCQAEVEKEGKITIPAETFTNIVRELPETEVTITIMDNHCLVSCDGNEYRLQTMSSEDFPLWSKFEAIASFEIPQKALRRLIAKTIVKSKTTLNQVFMLKTIFRP